MEGIRFPARKGVGRKSLPFIVFGLIAVLAGGVSPNLFAAPQRIGEQGQSAQASGQMDHGTIPTPLAVLIEEAKRNDPAIRAAEQTAKAATFVAPQMSALPDPQFTMQQFSVGSPRPFAGYTNSDFAYIGVGASQQLPYPGKLKLRGAVADRDADTAKAHIEVILQDGCHALCGQRSRSCRVRKFCADKFPE